MRVKHVILALALATIALAGCNKEENITITHENLWFPQETGHKTFKITADCDWSVSIDDGADWFTVSPMSGREVHEGTVTVTVQQSPTPDLRRGTFTITSGRGKVKRQVAVTQNLLSLNTDDLWFDHRNQTKSIEISADCNWTVNIDDGADWYTVSPMSGGKCSHEPIDITVNLFEGPNFRSSSFTVSSENGELAIRVRLSQNIIEIESLTNTIFSPYHIEHWNTDFYGMLIEDSYLDVDPNPYDTVSLGSYVMYFKEAGIGMQKDSHADSTVYYPFTYSFDLPSRKLNIEFETPIEGEVEDYEVTVITATNEVFRFSHEYREDTWEMAAMTKIGDIVPAKGKGQGFKPVFSKRKGRGPIFQF